MVKKNLSSEELTKLFDGPLEKNENDEYEYALYDQMNHCIYIKFDRIFNKESIKKHNLFKIQYKRYYSDGKSKSSDDSSGIPMLYSITQNLNTIMNRNNNLIGYYTRISMKINNSSELNEYKQDDFINDIKKLIINIIPDINKYVDEDYTLNLDANNEKVNVDLQVTDEMNKVYIGSAVGCRIVIPLICKYTANIKTTNLFYTIFRLIMLEFSKQSEHKTNPMNKLESVVRSRVEQTKYANKKIWKLISNHTNDMQLVRYNFTIGLIEQIIPKLETNRSSIIYIDVVLKRKLSFEFTYNFPLEYKPLRNLENDDDTDERDRLNEIIFTSRRDEAALALNKGTIRQHITTYLNDNDVDNNEIEEFATNFGKKGTNNIQKYFLFITYGKEFEVSIANEQDRVILLHELVNTLKNEGFTELPKILASRVENEIDIRNKVSGKKLKNQTAMARIIKKYEDVEDIIESDNFIIKMASFKNFNYFDKNDNPININGPEFEREIISFILAL